MNWVEVKINFELFALWFTFNSTKIQERDYTITQKPKYVNYQGLPVWKTKYVKNKLSSHHKNLTLTSIYFTDNKSFCYAKRQMVFLSYVMACVVVVQHKVSGSYVSRMIWPKTSPNTYCRKCSLWQFWLLGQTWVAWRFAGPNQLMDFYICIHLNNTTLAIS